MKKKRKKGNDVGASAARCVVPYLSSAVSAYVQSDCQASLFRTHHVVVSNLDFFFPRPWTHFYRLHTNDFFVWGLVKRVAMLPGWLSVCVYVCANVILLGMFFVCVCLCGECASIFSTHIDCCLSAISFFFFLQGIILRSRLQRFC